MDNEDRLVASIEETNKLLKHLIAIRLYELGAKQTDISKQLKLATKKVNDMLKLIPKRSND